MRSIVSKATALAVTDSLYHQTGDENYKGRKALRDLAEAGHMGAITGRGWYEYDAPYAEIVEERDRQLTDLLDWLRERDPVGRLAPR